MWFSIHVSPAVLHALGQACARQWGTLCVLPLHRPFLHPILYLPSQVLCQTRAREWEVAAPEPAFLGLRCGFQKDVNPPPCLSIVWEKVRLHLRVAEPLEEEQLAVLSCTQWQLHKVSYSGAQPEFRQAVFGQIWIGRNCHPM